jgi:hypothetical protein
VNNKKATDTKPSKEEAAFMKISLEKGRDRQGNLGLEDKIIEPASKPVDDDHFWCIICQDIRPLTVKGGVIGSAEIGGWMCVIHGK